MRRVLLFCAGVLLGLAAEALLWGGATLYADEEVWFSAGSITGLGLIADGAVAAAWAALCLARAFVPSSQAPAHHGTTLSRPVPAAVWGGPLLPICAILFFLGAVGPFWQARDELGRLDVMESFPNRNWPDVTEDTRRIAQMAFTCGILYVVVGGALLAAPMFLKPRNWQLGRRINGAGCGIVSVGLLLSGVGFLVVIGNGLMMEGAKESVGRVGGIGVLGGGALAVVGSLVAVVRRSSHPRGQNAPADRGRDSDLP